MPSPEPTSGPLHQLCPEGHPLVRAVANGNEGVELLRLIRQQMAEAAAELGFLDQHRDELEAEDLLRRGRDITRIVRALKRFADLEVARLRRFGRPPVKLDDPAVLKVLDLLVERVIEIGYEVLPTANADELDQALRDSLASDPTLPWPRTS